MSSESIASNLKSASAVNTAGPGKLLRQTREEKNISLADIAAQLKLSQQHVMALEADDYRHINSLIFLKGYLRNYAHIVGVAPETVIAQIDNRQFEQSRDRPPAIEYKVKLFTRDQLTRWLTLGFGVVMVALVLSWWHSHSQVRSLTLLPSTHTKPTLPGATPGAGGLDQTVPLFEDGELSNTGGVVDDVTPDAPNTPDKPEPVESFADATDATRTSMAR